LHLEVGTHVKMTLFVALRYPELLVPVTLYNDGITKAARPTFANQFI